MSNGKDQNNRKRSRWGGAPTPAPSLTAVSDQDALCALLQSAESREREKELKKRGRQDDDRRSQRKPMASNKNKSIQVAEDNYYARPGDRGGTLQDDSTSGNTTTAVAPTEKPNFGLSGALAKDELKGNTYKGVVLKFSEPPEARAPNTLWRLYVFKGDEQIETLHVSKQSAYLFGRNAEIADVALLHVSCSSQHAVLQYRALPNKETGKLQCQPYLMDLESTNGTFINGVQIDAARYYQLKKGDVFKFGASTREYVLLTATTTSLEP